MSRFATLGIVLVVACGGEPASSGAPSSSASADGLTPLPPEPPLPPNPPACPGAWSEMLASDGAVCGGGAPSRCSYAEGTCECVGWWSECRGAPPTPPPRLEGQEEAPPSDEELGHVRCTPRPPARRADGCPRDEPPVGFACTGTPERCGYGGPPSCCSIEYVCVDGAWARGQDQCLP